MNKFKVSDGFTELQNDGINKRIHKKKHKPGFFLKFITSGI